MAQLWQEIDYCVLTLPGTGWPKVMVKRSKTRKKSRRRRRSRRSRLVAFVLRSGLLMLLLSVLVTVLLVLPWRWINPPTTAYMWRAAQQSGTPNQQIWLPSRSLSPHIHAAVLAAEDQLFFHHNGFDVKQIKAALSTPGGPQRGASTITQQVAKNLYLWPAQSYARKVIEAFLTLTIEGLWPKQRILEVYLNIAEFGPGIYGVGAAAESLLDTPAADLTAQQAALLAAVLPSPRRLSARDPSPYVRQRAREIMQSVEQLRGTDYLVPVHAP